jgi:hypothetical protein
MMRTYLNYNVKKLPSHLQVESFLELERPGAGWQGWWTHDAEVKL